MEDLNKRLISLYEKLLKKHNYQGWWPIKGKYHPRDYTYPKNKEEIFEIIIGAILTQNTLWKNVEKSLEKLHENNLISLQTLLKTSNQKLAQLIKSAGYFNQKIKKLKLFAEFHLKNERRIPLRKELLNIWGIGKETADSILLYAYKRPIFVVDNYTKKIAEKYLGVNSSDYDELQDLFHKNLPRDYKLYNEFHALIVAEGKNLK